MEIKYKVDEDLYIDYIYNNVKSKKKRIAKIIVNIILVAIIFGTLMYSKYMYDIENYGYLKSGASIAMIMYIICGVLWVILVPILQSKVENIQIIGQAQKMGQAVEEEITLTLDNDGIIKKSDSYEVSDKWSQITSMTESEGSIALKVKGEYPILIPVSSFSDEDKKSEFIDFINGKIKTEDLGDAKDADKMVRYPL